MKKIQITECSIGIFPSILVYYRGGSTVNVLVSGITVYVMYRVEHIERLTD